jgi:hypothetical protein
MHKNDDGSVSFSALEAKYLSKVLPLAEELTYQLEARDDPGSPKCEDRLLGYLMVLKDRFGVTGEEILRLQ